jgi:hypothetical protein
MKQVTGFILRVWSLMYKIKNEQNVNRKRNFNVNWVQLWRSNVTTSQDRCTFKIWLLNAEAIVQFQISRKKFEPEPGLEPRTSRILPEFKIFPWNLKFQFLKAQIISLYQLILKSKIPISQGTNYYCPYMHFGNHIIYVYWPICILVHDRL